MNQMVIFPKKETTFLRKEIPYILKLILLPPKVEEFGAKKIFILKFELNILLKYLISP